MKLLNHIIILTFLLSIGLSSAYADFDETKDLIENKQYEQAIDILEKHLQDKPKDAAAKDLLLDAYRGLAEQDKLREVIDTTQGVIEESKLLNEAKNTFDRMEIDLSIDPLEDIKKLGDFKSVFNHLKDKGLKQATEYQSMIRLYEKMGDLDGIKSGLRKMIELNPSDQDALLNLALVEVDKGNSVEAEKYFLRYLAVDDKSDRVLDLFALAYVSPQKFMIGSLVGGFLGLLFFAFVFLKENDSKNRLFIILPVGVICLTLFIAAISWYIDRSMASFLVLICVLFMSLLFTFYRLFRPLFKPGIALIEKIVTSIWSAFGGVFSGRVSGKMSNISTRYLVIMLILIVPLSLSLLSFAKAYDLRIIIIIASTLVLFTIVGALALAFLKKNESLGKTLKYLSLFNTLPFLLVFLYLAGGVVDKMLSFSFSSVNSWEQQLLLASLVLYLFGLGFAMYLAVIQTQAILTPVTALTSGVSKVESGDLSVKIEIESSDELGILSNGFNRMVDGLRQREFIRSIFGKFVDPRVVESVIKDRNIDLGGKSANIVVMFTDIRGFTSLSERVNAEDLVDTLNDYFTRMVAVIEDHGGLVNKFIGDAMMVVWGGIVGEEKDATRAIKAGLAMQKVLREFNREREESGEWPIKTGIGVNSGMAIAGHLGSLDRLEWTVMGDTVNLAQRAESNAKDGQVLVSPHTFEPIQDKFEATQLDPIQVKGKAKPIAFYNVTGSVE